MGHPADHSLDTLQDIIGSSQVESDNKDPLYRLKRVMLILTGHTLLPPKNEKIQVIEESLLG